MFFEKECINYDLKPTKEQKNVLKSLRKGDIVLAKQQFGKKSLKEIDQYGR